MNLYTNMVIYECADGYNKSTGQLSLAHQHMNSTAHEFTNLFLRIYYQGS